MKEVAVPENVTTHDVLVTGAAGVLGSRIVEVLRRSGKSVAAAGRTASPSVDTLWDLLDSGSPDRAIRPRVVVHAAAQMAGMGAVLDPDDDLFEINVGGTKRVVEWSLTNAVEKLVFISGALVYGGWQTEPRSESYAVEPASGGSYAESKLLGEQIAEQMTADGRQLSILRLSSLYGRGYDAGLPQRLIREGTETGEIHLTPPVDTAFDLLHVNDAARAVERTLDLDSGGLWNVGSGRTTTLMELTETCGVATGARVIVDSGGSESGPGVMNWVNDSKAREELGYRNFVDLGAGIESIVD